MDTHTMFRFRSEVNELCVCTEYKCAHYLLILNFIGINYEAIEEMLSS